LAQKSDNKSQDKHSTHRQVELLDVLRKVGGTARNASLASALGVSEETIRRTVKTLAKANLVRRVHGGVYLASVDAEESVFHRLGKHSGEKSRIAKCVVDLVEDGSCIFLGVGSTTSYVAERLRARANLSVVTNALNAAQVLLENEGNRVFLAGGELQKTECGTFDGDTLDYVGRFDFDVAILSVDGVDLETGYLLASSAEAVMARRVSAGARRTFILADNTKFGQRAALVACPKEAVSVVITDSRPSKVFARKLAEWGTELIVAEESAQNE
jgi:DeoR family glycerol-3-phosphate regulon repressor